jgi:hypothetical protein
MLRWLILQPSTWQAMCSSQMSAHRRSTPEAMTSGLTERGLLAVEDSEGTKALSNYVRGSGVRRYM